MKPSSESAKTSSRRRFSARNNGERLLEQGHSGVPVALTPPLGGRQSTARRLGSVPAHGRPRSRPSASRRRASLTCACARQKRSSALTARSASSTRPDVSSQSRAARRLSTRARDGQPLVPGRGRRARVSASSASSRKCSAWRSRSSSSALSARRRSSACSRTVSSIESRTSPSLASLRTRLQPTSASRSVRKASPAARDRTRVGERRAVGEDRQAAVQGTLAVGEPLVAPVDRRAKRALPFGKIERPFHLEREPLAERPHDLGWREHDEPCGDELDRERQTVEPPADLVHRRKRVGLQHDAPRRRELDEERGRVVERQRLERQRLARSRGGAACGSWRGSAGPVRGRAARRRDTAARARCSRLSRYRRAPVPFSRSAIASSSGSSPVSRTPSARAIALGHELGSVDRERDRRGARAARSRRRPRPRERGGSCRRRPGP